MKVAIVGSSGYIAKALTEHFQKISYIEKIIRIGRSENDDLMLELNNCCDFDYSSLIGIDYIIFTAAISSPDKCSNEYEQSYKVNVEGTSNFIRNALDKGCKVLFFSSDAVYGSDLGEVFDENSVTSPITAYGCMKKLVEDNFSNEQNFKVIRLSYVVSKNDRFISYCIKCIDDKIEAEIFHPFYRNCVSLNNVCLAVIWIVNNWSNFTPWVLNVVGSELVSRVRIADELNRIFNDKLDYKIITPDDSFFKNRYKITEVKSVYNLDYKIYNLESFSESLCNELKGI